MLYIEGSPGSGKSRALAREAIRLIVQDGIASDQLRIIVQNVQQLEAMETYLVEESKLAETPLPSITIQTWHTFLLKLLRLYADKITLPNSKSPLPHQVHAVNYHQAILTLSQITTHYCDSGKLPAGFNNSDIFLNDLYQWILEQQSKGKMLSPRVSISEEYELIFGQISTNFLNMLYTKGLLTGHDISGLGYELIKTLIEEQDNEKSIENTFGDIEALLLDDVHLMESDDHEILSHLARVRPLTVTSSNLYENAFINFTDLPITYLSLQVSQRNNEPLMWWLSQWYHQRTQQHFWEEAPDSLENTLSTISSHAHFLKASDEIAESENIVDLLSHFRGQKILWHKMAILVPNVLYRNTITDMLAARNIPVYGEQSVGNVMLSSIQHFVYDALKVLDYLLSSPEHSIQTLFSNELNGEKTDAEDDTLKLFSQERLLRGNLKRLIAQVEENSLFNDEENQEAVSPYVKITRWFEQTPKKLLKVEQSTSGNTETENRAVKRVLTEQLWQLLVLTDFFKSNAVDSSQQAALITLSGFTRKLSLLQDVTNDASALVRYVLDHFTQIWPNETTNLELKPGVQVVVANGFNQQAEAFVSEPEVLIICGMVDGKYPTVAQYDFGNSKDKQDTDIYFMQNQHHEKNEMRHLITLALQTQKHLVLSAPETMAGKTMPASLFYQELHLLKETLLKHNAIDDSSDNLMGNTQLNEIEHLLEKTPERSYQVENEWSVLRDNPVQQILYADEPLVLSPSSVTTYMKCPRQFYYKNVLSLPEETSDAANVGLLVHSLMEHYNNTLAGKKVLPVDQHAAGLKSTAQLWFSAINYENSEDSEGTSVSGVLDSRILNALKKMDPVAIETLQKNVVNTIDDLNQRGYFTKYGECAVKAEEKLEEFCIAGINKASFKGKLDALIETAPDEWMLVDYKNYGTSKFGTLPDKCQKNFTEKLLAPLPKEAGDHETLFANRLDNTYPADYQLILYYLGVDKKAEFTDKVKNLCLQVVRPTFEDHAEKGSLMLTVSTEELKKVLPQIITDMNDCIVSPIYQSKQFDTNPGEICDRCSYRNICPASSEQENVS